MADYRAIEAFARGAMLALLGTDAGRVDAARKPGRRRTRPTDSAPAPSPRQLDLLPISAPGARDDEIPAPPFTQAEAERMERVLRGESPNGSYAPTEGVAPWMES